MSFERKDLSVLSYANGFTLWHYKSSDPTPTPIGYFDEAGGMLRVGDMIMANMSNGNTIFAVTRNENGNVSVASLFETSGGLR